MTEKINQFGMTDAEFDKWLSRKGSAALPSHVESEISFHMEEIQRFFKNSKITLVMRAPGFPNGDRDLVMSDDDLDQAIEAIRIRQRAIQGAPAVKDHPDLYD